MADYLREMAARGWLLERAGEFVAKFRASEPQDLQFTVDVFPYEGRLVSKNNPQAQEYRQMCAESGWQFLTSRDYCSFSLPRVGKILYRCKQMLFWKIKMCAANFGGLN